MYSTTPDIISFPSTYRQGLLSKKQIDCLKNSTKRLLEEIGIRFPSKNALEIFSDHGASVNMETQIVRIPADLVENAMAKAPRTVLLAGREERFDLILDGSRSYLAGAGTAPTILDLETRKKRPTCKNDQVMMARVCDALPFIGYVWTMASAQDFGVTAPLHECYANLTNTLKHVRGGSTLTPELAPFVVEMATAVAGSEENRRQRPPLNANICSVSPLSHDPHGIESGLVYAEAGIPTSYMTNSSLGATVPATPLGGLVVSDAEIVSAIVLMQLAHPGAPVLHANVSGQMDPRTGGFIGDPSRSRAMRWIGLQLAHAWGVPALCGATMAEDPFDVGLESAMQSGLGAAHIPIAGGEISALMGQAETANKVIPEKLILDHETCKIAHELYFGIEFNEKDMVFDLIEQVGHGNHYLMEDHTLEHVKDLLPSPLFSAKDAEGNMKNPRELALEEFKNINENHHPEPLPDKVLKELDDILDEAERIKDKLG